MASDPYDVRSRFGGTFNYCFNLFGRGTDGGQMQRNLADYNDAGRYLLCDFYPLNGTTAQRHDDRWIVEQWHNPADGSGILFAFRRSLAENVTFAAAFRGVDPNVLYELCDCDTKEVETVRGSQLAAGYRIRLQEPRTSILIKYHRK